MRNGLRAALALGVLATALVVPTTASATAACPGDDVVPTMDTAKQGALELICDIEAVRITSGLPMLHWDWKLWWISQHMASDLAGSSTFSHTAPDGKDLYDRAAPTGYLNDNSDGLLLENLAWARGPEASPLAIVLSWLASDGHRKNLLDPEIEDMGIGIAEGAPTPGGDDGIFYVVDFGRRGQVMDSLVVTPQGKVHHKAYCSRARRAHRGHTSLRKSSRRSRCGRTLPKRSSK